MEPRIARKIGRQIALKYTLYGLLIAYFLFAYFEHSWGAQNALIWITQVEFTLNLMVGVAGLLLLAYGLGQRAGMAILLRRRPFGAIGVLYAFLILGGGSLIGSSVGFLQELAAAKEPFRDLVVDYYAKPLYWIFLFGALPTVLLGLLFGAEIQRVGKKSLAAKGSDAPTQ